MNENYKKLLLNRHPFTIEILEHVNMSCKKLGFEFMIIGAQARDLIMEGKYKLSIGGTTLDIDFAVVVDSWEQYHDLKEELIHKGFQSVKGKKQKLSYKDEYTIDLVPFGNLEKEGKIFWPPDEDPEMNIIGFNEVIATSESIHVDDRLSIKVSSLAGLTILKIIAWNDRKYITKKDGEDLALILKNYIEAGNLYRVYEDDNNNVLEDVNCDYDLASARLLGIDVSRIANEQTKVELCSIIDDELNENKDEILIQAMMSCFANNYELTRSMLETFRVALDVSKF